MPIYEYACTACGAKFEIFQGIKDAPLTDCRACTKSTLQKLVSATGFQLKGDGWYATGYETKSTTTTEPVNNTAVSVSDVSSKPETSIS